MTTAQIITVAVIYSALVFYLFFFYRLNLNDAIRYYQSENISFKLKRKIPKKWNYLCEYERWFNGERICVNKLVSKKKTLIVGKEYDILFNTKEMIIPKRPDVSCFCAFYSIIAILILMPGLFYMWILCFGKYIGAI